MNMFNETTFSLRNIKMYNYLVLVSFILIIIAMLTQFRIKKKHLELLVTSNFKIKIKFPG